MFGTSIKVHMEGQWGPRIVKKDKEEATLENSSQESKVGETPNRLTTSVLAWVSISESPLAWANWNSLEWVHSLEVSIRFREPIRSSELSSRFDKQANPGLPVNFPAQAIGSLLEREF